MSVLVRLAYDGTDFHGFARQAPEPGGREVRTVQATVEQGLCALYGGQPVHVRAASRTDAGVHARGQLIAFDPPFSIPLRGVLLGLTSHLPADVAPADAWEERGPGDEPVDPRRGNLGKRYRYRIRWAELRDPLERRMHWHLRRSLELDPMRLAAAALVGEHDFSAFRGRDCQAKTTVRRVTAVRAHAEPLAPGTLCIEVEGQAFLKNMVRIIVGTLVEVGLGRRDPRSVAELLQTRERRAAGPTAPARGLVLDEVKWPGRP